MKRIIALALTLATVLCLFAACGEKPADTTAGKQPTTNTTAPGTTASQPTAGTAVPTEPTEPTDPWAEYETITIAQALEMCDQFVDAPSADRFYIRAIIVSIDSETYGQMTIKDETGEIMVYGTYSADGSVRYDKMDKKPVAGDEILIYGTLQNYNGKTKEVQNARLIDFISNGVADEPVELPADGTVMTIAEALELAAKLESGKPTTQRYYITATVESVTNPAYGAMIINDGTGSISVYNSMNADGTVAYADMAEKPYKGDEVKVYCTLQNFNGNAEIKSAWIIEFKPAENAFNEADYTEMSIADARDAVTGTKVKVTGVVARLTYANGYKPSGVILVDGTSSIYVYDGDLAGRVSIGNTITVAASKTYWILGSESANAEKFGYIGCNQLESAWLLSNDNGNSDFDKTWIEETTVKEIMDTDFSEDITTKIYKVTALVKKVEGTGFTNYYINDLDGYTGSYVYTQCSGSDFGWLDEFDGKICTVYMVALNAKSSTSGCNWRFLPVAVTTEGVDLSSVNIPMNAVKLYGIPQFLPSYSGNPALKLLTSVNNELLGYTDAILTYTSADSTIIEFVTVDGQTVMNCLNPGSTTITVTATHNGVTYSEDFTITVTANAQVEYVDVNTALNAQDGETVTVMGIVGPSLVNQDGFYLIDETGIVAVLVNDSAILDTLEIGYEIVIQGVRFQKQKEDSTQYGQTCINNAEVLVNNYGNHEYATNHFVTDKTLAEIIDVDVTEDHTTTVYVLDVTIRLDEQYYFSNIYVDADGASLILYCNNSGQYSWLKQYAGQTVTVELVLCNWNCKGYKGCVLSATLEDGTKIYNEYNFN